MYSPSHFAEDDPEVLVAAARAIGAGHVITLGEAGIEDTLVPLVVSDDGAKVAGHLARANRQWARVDTSVPALITWTGPMAYVSPSFYPSTTEHGKTVPTWNYLVVQARGTLVVHEDERWLRSVVSTLTALHEASSPTPWTLEDAPGEYVEHMLRAIVGIELEVASWKGAWKLSQNRSDADRAGVEEGLSARGGDQDVEVAALMRSLG